MVLTEELDLLSAYIHERWTIIYANKTVNAMDTVSLLFDNVQEYVSKLIKLTHQGPVVQSIVRLTSSLRGQLVKCFATL